MSGAQSWKGIDPKVREAAREAAARQGISLGEYLHQALAKQRSAAAAAPRYSLETAGDWRSEAAPRGDAQLAQRVESIERRTQQAVTGLDRAMASLSSRVEDAEAATAESVDRISDALEQFRIAGDTLSGLSGVKERLENQAAVAEEVARRAEAAASYLTTELENRDEALKQTLSEARMVAEEAARQASQASADAVAELRALQDDLSERLAHTETSTRRAVESAIEEVRAEQAHENRGTREALLEEVVRLEGEISRRLGAAEQLKADQSALISRIEKAEHGAREATAGLRQAAGAAIADLRNAQLTMSARLKQIEETAGQSGALDLADLRHQQQDIAERLASLEHKADSDSPVSEALNAFEQRLARIEQDGGGGSDALDQALQRLSERLAETESSANTAIRTLEETVSSLSAKIEQNAPVQETEAVRAMLEQRLDAMAQNVREELTGQIQAALEGGEGMESALTDVNRRLAAAERRQAQTIEAISHEIRRMSESVDHRLRAVEARNDDAAASAVREELSRMAETLEQRFDEIERREAAAFDRMGLEVGRLSERLEERVGAVENRSAQAIEQVGEQVARMAERLNQRHDTLERDLGERMTDSEERAGSRVDEAINSIMERLAEVEAHSAEAIAPVHKAVSSVASKLSEYEQTRGDAEPQAFAPPLDDDEFSSFDDGGGDDFAAFGEEAPAPHVSPMDAAQPLRAGPLAPSHAETVDEDDIYFAEDDEPAASAAPSVFDPPDATFDSSASPEPMFEGDAVAPPPEEDDDPFWTPEDEPPALTAMSAPDSAQDDIFAPTDEEFAVDEFADNADSEPSVFGELEESAPQSEAELELESADDLPFAPDLEPQEPPPPPGKNDYLAAARAAALAQSQPEPEKKPKLKLRGPSRVVLWTGAGVAALLLAGGAWYVSNRGAAPATPGEAEADAPQTGVPQLAPQHSLDAADPLAEDPANAATGAEEVPVAEADGERVVAGPMAARGQTLEQAAQAGVQLAQYELGLQRLAAGRTQEGVTLIRRAADRGFPMAQYRMAKLYERGEGVEADLVVARQWTERAAGAGNRRAMHDLGVYFARGEGAPLDEAAAFRWFRQAAELGVADSQYNLGILYQQGRGVNASPAEALFWFLVAARQGDQDAGARAAGLEAQLAANQVEQARSRAQAFRPRAASAVANGEFGPRPWSVSRGGA